MDGGPELLDSGRPDEEGALRRFRRAHPRVVVAALVVAAVAGAGWVAARALSGPDLSALSVGDVSLLGPSLGGGDAGRGDAGAVGGVGEVLARIVLFTVTAPGLHPGDEPWDVAALGLDGPGIVEVSGSETPGAVPLGPGRQVRLAARVAVDCGAIGLPVDAAAYGLRVMWAAEAGQATGVLPLGREVEPWARAVEAECARAEAARTVRVVSVAGEVDPTRPIVDLRFLLENDGPHVVEVIPYGGPFLSESGEGGGSLDLAPAPRTWREVWVRTTLDPCPSSGPPWGSGRREESWPAGVSVAVAGVLGQSDPRLPLGLDPTASRALLGLLTEACAGLPTLAIDVPAEGVRYDPATRVLEGAVVVTPPADWVGRLSVGPTPAEEYGRTLEPLWQPSAFTGPGQTDPITVAVRYRIPVGGTWCGDEGPVVRVDVQARVPSGAAERTARLQGDTQVPWPAGVDSAMLCLY